jgi:UTP--glucose-1-phosphate uridylyltransferase
MPHADVTRCPDDAGVARELLNRLVIVKLNGGLGTSMGLRGPKSALEVRSGLTFLDLAVKQVEYLNERYGVDVPLVLMNSFWTHRDTQQIIRKYASHHITMHTFMQSCYPRIDKDTLWTVANAPCCEDTKHLWYPPGHGDLYASMANSGLLDELLRAGKTHVFISNVDNLGATADLDILWHIMDKEVEFAMEVTARTRADKKGGALCADEGGKPRLVELAQVPRERLKQFQRFGHGSSTGTRTSACGSEDVFGVFNTNSLWVNLEAIKSALTEAEGGGLDLQTIVNHRIVQVAGMAEPREVVQLESAAGDAMSLFRNAIAIEVDRSRFVPIKSTSDLLVVQSDLYSIQHGTLRLDPIRAGAVPTVKLGATFSGVDSYAKRFPHGMPKTKRLERLTVTGDVTFGANVKLQGTVVIAADDGRCIDIPDNADLDNVVVTGSLKIIEL